MARKSDTDQANDPAASWPRQRSHAHIMTGGGPISLKTCGILLLGLTALLTLPAIVMLTIILPPEGKESTSHVRFDERRMSLSIDFSAKPSRKRDKPEKDKPGQ